MHMASVGFRKASSRASGVHMGGRVAKEPAPAEPHVRETVHRDPSLYTAKNKDM